MAFKQYTATLTEETIAAGEYYVVAIGPGGTGATGGTSTGSNSKPGARTDGAAGGAGGAGAYVFVDKMVSEGGTLTVRITQDATILSGALSLSIPKAGSGSEVGGAGGIPAVPGNSLSASNYVGSRGGGAGGMYGTKITSGTQPNQSPVAGGLGTNGNGDPSTVGSISGTVRAGGKGGKGGANTEGAGLGGRGAQANGLSITSSNIKTITAMEIAQRIAGGNGSNGTAPASRVANTGISGGNGGGGGGAWTSGSNGTTATAPGYGVNGKGGTGGAGGLGAVWLMEVIQQKER